jgi:hypothetical protein
MEWAATALCLSGFFETGCLVRHDSPAMAVFSDSEYLCGAIDFVKQLSDQYTLGRATEQDTASIELCRDLTEQVRIHTQFTRVAALLHALTFTPVYRETSTHTR